jgi:cysteine-rich repeat protein
MFRLFITIVTISSLCHSSGQARSQASLGDLSIPASRVPDWNHLDYLPLDSSSWAQVSPAACTAQALQDAIDAVSSPTRINLLSNCTLEAPPNSQWYIANEIGFPLEFNGAALGAVIEVGKTDPRTTGRGRGLRDKVFQVGGRFPQNGPAQAPAISWLSGFDLGNQDLTLDSTAGLSVGQIVRLVTDDWDDFHSNMDFGQYARLTCVGTSGAAGCGSLTATQVRIDNPLYMDYSGTTYEFGPTEGRSLIPITAMPQHIGFRNLKIVHHNPDMHRDSFMAIDLKSCFECWIINNDLPRWGTGVIATSQSARVVIRGNRMQGPYFQSKCIVDIVNVTASNPVVVEVEHSNDSVRNPSDCTNTWANNGFEPTLYIQSSAMPELEGRRFRRSADLGGAAVGHARVSLLGENGTGRSEGPGGLASLAGAWNVGAIYITRGASQIVVENNAFIDVNAGPLTQGGVGSIIAYNYQTVGANDQCARGVFFHGAASTSILVEGNDLECGINLYENLREAEGPHNTIFRNRVRGFGVDGGGFGGELGDVMRRGALGWENFHNPHGTTTQFFSILGNWAEDTWGISQNVIDRGDHTPAYVSDMWIEKNIFHNGQLRIWSSSQGPNPTTNNIDNHSAEAAPASWGTFAFPASLYRTEAPPWWCQESGPFPNIGAPVDNRNGGSPVLSKLPAQIRAEGGTCTPLDAAPPPPCGNGTLDSGEQCDDGNTRDGDCCSSECQFEALGSSCLDDVGVPVPEGNAPSQSPAPGQKSGCDGFSGSSKPPMGMLFLIGLFWRRKPGLARKVL